MDLDEITAAARRKWREGDVHYRLTMLGFRPRNVNSAVVQFSLEDAERLAERLEATEIKNDSDECPAGGPHTWGTREEWGTGRIFPACEECGAQPPIGEQDDRY